MKTLVALSVLIALAMCAPRRDYRQEAAEVTAESRSPIVRLSRAWSTAPEQTTCESVLYDAQRNVIYVSNINGQPREMNGKGFLSRLSTDGHTLDLLWVTGLHAPKGMAIKGDRLFVSDIIELVEIDIPEGKIVGKYGIEGASFMNDVAVAADGGIYVSDSDTGTIYVLRNDRLQVWTSGDEFNRPNGLWDNGPAMLVGNSGDGTLVAVRFSDLSVEHLADSLGHTDGIAPDGRGNFFVSSWNGQIFFVRSDWQVSKILDTEANNKNCADIDYIQELKLLVVPTFFGNTVEAYRVEYGY